MGGFSSPNDLLKFVDSVSEKGCESQCRWEWRFKLKDNQGSYQNLSKLNVFLCHTTQKFQNFPGKIPISLDPLMGDFPKMGRFPTIGRCHEEIFLEASPQPSCLHHLPRTWFQFP